jgi:hypothetical protein
MLAPIAVFAFNRPDHLGVTLEALAANRLAGESHLTIFCDAPRGPKDAEGCQRVVEVARDAFGFASVTVVQREANHGCAASVIRGTNEMFAQHERLIVIEDDILTSPFTLAYLNQGLEQYQRVPAVFSISAWAPPQRMLRVPDRYRFNSYFIRRFHCWGWASWRDRWACNDWSVPGYAEYRQDAAMRAAHAEGGSDLPGMLDNQMAGRIDSWAIRAEYTRFRLGGLALYPRVPLVRNIGMDGTGRHCGNHDPYADDLRGAESIFERPFPNVSYIDRQLSTAFRKVYSGRRILDRIGRLLLRKIRP